jgi:hypothetical protein
MTDKELFEKTEKQFNLKKNSKVEKVFEEGSFNKVLNEVRGPKSPNLGGAAQTAGGFLNRIAAAIPGTRGHRMRSAEARKQEAEAKKAEVEARAAQQRQIFGNSQKTRPYEDWCKKREEKMKISPLSDRGQKMYDKHCGLTPPGDKPGKKPTPPGDKPGKKPTPPGDKPGEKPTPPEIKFKVGDEVFVKTKKNPKAEGIVTALLDKPGFIQVKVGNAPYAFDKRNVSLRRGINKESFAHIVKKYR